MIIPSRYNGPPASGNGGVTCGLVAAHLDAPVVEVTLRQPPPLNTELVWRGDGVYDGDLLIAAAAPGDVVLEAPAPVGFDAASGAVSALGRFEHPFPTCFVCGNVRSDGLGLLPGRVSSDVVAAPWIPSAAADLEPSVLVWAALDCPGGWSADLPSRPMVLGRMSLVLDVPPVLEQPHVVQGWLVGTEGRKVHTGSALYDEGGRVMAVAQQTWITLSP